MALQELYVALCLAVVAHLSVGSLLTCSGVRREFVLKHGGEGGAVPDTPTTGSDLQVCVSRNLTCCTRKMEERFQLTAWRDIQNLLHTSSTGLKLLLSRSIAGIQEAVEAMVREAENQTVALLHSSVPELGDRVAPPVAELFTDVALFVLGAELGLEEAVQRFFHALFPPVFERVLEAGPDLDPAYSECVRSVGHDLAPFGNAVPHLSRSLSLASLPQRVLLQALHLGVEVVNTTDRLQFQRHCKRALLRMSYCPHCHQLTSKPCTGYCLNVLRGCLASLAEVDSHWREFVHSLELLSGRMNTEKNLEQTLSAVPSIIRDAIRRTHQSAPWLSAQVREVCGRPVRLRSGAGVRRGFRDSAAPQNSAPAPEESLSSRRRECISALRVYRAFYGGLADQLCVTELGAGDGSSCWNGENIVKSYTRRVVGSGVKEQEDNPEVRVKEVDPVINQMIDKLKHINLLLQGRSIPKYGTLDQIETGSGFEDPNSGDCDDEDGCWGSGKGPGSKRTNIKTTHLSPKNSSKNRNLPPHTRVSGESGSSGSSASKGSSACGTLHSFQLVLISAHTLLLLSPPGGAL